MSKKESNTWHGSAVKPPPPSHPRTRIVREDGKSHSVFTEELMVDKSKVIFVNSDRKPDKETSQKVFRINGFDSNIRPCFQCLYQVEYYCESGFSYRMLEWKNVEVKDQYAKSMEAACSIMSAADLYLK